MSVATTEPTRREGRALASPLRLTVDPGADPAVVDRAWAAVRAVFERVDATMSRYRADSEITRLNRAAGPVVGLSRELVNALTVADRAGRMTDGRFDARVVADLERLGSVGGGVHVSLGSSERARPNGRLLRRDGRLGPVTLCAPVDLGGIGKGLALRRAARRAAAILGAAGFLVEAGGDIASRGLFGGGRWSIGIEDPAGAVVPVAVCVLERDQAIATSSIRLARWVDPDGRQAHHLIDPATGEPGGAGLTAVTVAWTDPAWAEVWSKALFLEGAASIAAAARARGLAAWWISESGELAMTPAARQQTSWVRAEASQPRAS